MRITRENVSEFTSVAESLKEELEAALEAAEAWDGFQDEPRTADNAEEIRQAREELEDALNNMDASTLCQLIHGKHKSK